MTLSDADLAEFAEILAAAGTRAKVRGKPAPSVLYDATYHFAIIACTFHAHAKGNNGTRSLLAPWLKLVQFVAARPRLLPDLKEWLSDRKRKTLDAWARMPRGYLADKTHDDAINLLAAAGILGREGDDLVAGARVAYLDKFAQAIEAENLFVNERAVIAELVNLRPPRTALEGN